MGTKTFVLAFLWLVGLSCCSGKSSWSRKRVCPTYVVSLDLPPEDRWTKVITGHRLAFVGVVEKIHNSTAKRNITGIDQLVANFSRAVPQEFAEEIRGVARVAGVDQVDVFLLNLVYELSAYCTSIVGQDTKGGIWHGRNFDYVIDSIGLTVDILKKLTIEVDFQRNGKTVYFGTGVVGYVAIHTGQRPGQFTVSINQRDIGGFMENVAMALYEGGKPATMVIRETLENATNYAEAVEQMSTTKLIAAAYFIIGGLNPGEGVIITRDRRKAADVLSLNSSRWYVLQTNYDHWTTPPTWDNRRTPGKKAMIELGQQNLDGAGLLKVLGTKGPMNNLTIATTIMRAADPTLYQTWIRYDAIPASASGADNLRQSYILMVLACVLVRGVLRRN